MAGKFDAIKPTVRPDPSAFIEAAVQRAEPQIAMEPSTTTPAKKRIKKQKMIIMSDETDALLEQTIVDLMRSHPERHRQLNRSTLIAAAIHYFAQQDAMTQINHIDKLC